MEPGQSDIRVDLRSSCRWVHWHPVGLRRTVEAIMSCAGISDRLRLFDFGANIWSTTLVRI